jgi:hypothetical protein
VVRFMVVSGRIRSAIDLSCDLIVLPESSIEWISYASIPGQCLSDGGRLRGRLITPPM